jgi:large subunit ribosomal protein L25
MKQITLQATLRTKTGRTTSRALRNAGSIPAVIYGESGVRHLAINEHAFALVYREIAGRAALIELAIEGQSETTYAIIQDKVQRDSCNDDYLHIDFKEVVRGRDMEASIPLQLKGTAEGVKTFGGVLELHHDHVKVRCRPRNLPEVIEVDVTRLLVGDSIFVRDLVPPADVTILEGKDIVVVSCVGSSAAASAEATDAAAPAA